MHPWEDWAETWAHYMHIMDTLETACSFGLSVNPQVTAEGLRADIKQIHIPPKTLTRLCRGGTTSLR